MRKIVSSWTLLFSRNFFSSSFICTHVHARHVAFVESFIDCFILYTFARQTASPFRFSYFQTFSLIISLYMYRKGFAFRQN
jgi:hypothetical protein